MQDRNSAQTCVTCDIYAEKTQATSKISKAIEHLGEKEGSEEPFKLHKSTVQEVKRGSVPSKKSPPPSQQV